MKWSFKLMRLWGIDVYIHYTFLLLLAFVGFRSGIHKGNWAGALGDVAFFLSLFACVLLHEYGHALAARRYGVPTRDITLLPIGGVARLERMPDNPRQELVIAIAGPLVNVVIAAGLGAGLMFTGATGLTLDQLAGASFMQSLLAINVGLILFNMLPAFPMDGGRVLRAVLAMFMDPVRATNIAATIGKIMSVGFLVAAFTTSNPILGLIAVFVWLGAGGEAAAVQARSALGDAPVARAMLTEFQVVAPTDPLSRAAELMISGSQTDFPVVAEGRVVGVLSRADLFAALARAGEFAPVEQAMKTDFVTLQAAESLEAALPVLSASGSPLAPVVAQGRVVGILTLENASEFISLQRARAANRRVPPTIAAAAPPVIR
ncbi:MAG TPA: site-2 protease family protein [Verrucomicrobiota bacterium]|nr:site-2 protease family protein [Verrucomicrobiales bacterium]HRI14351.1 site-2 protease family protein [Verrucomicrobiota bacterium]